MFVGNRKQPRVHILVRDGKVHAVSAQGYAWAIGMERRSFVDWLASKHIPFFGYGYKARKNDVWIFAADA